MTIEDFLRLLLRNVVLLVAVTALGAGAGFGLSFTRPTVYSASALGYVSAGTGMDETGSPVTQAGANIELQYTKAQSYLPLLNTRAVGQRIVDSQGLAMSADDVAASLQGSLDPNAPIMTVTALASSPEAASDIANAAVEATAAEVVELEGDSAVTQLVPYQTALAPGAPESPDRERFLLAGAALGLMLALGLAFLRDRNDSRIRTSDDIERLVSVPLLGVLPDDKDLQRPKDGALPEPKSFQVRESLRKLRTNLRFISVDNPPRSIVVTSSAPAEGKSTVSGNLARVMARSGQKTLLIDADLRRPQIATEFRLDGEVGLTQLLAGGVDLADVIHQVGDSRLWVLPAGQIPPNPSELLGSRRMRQLIEEMSHDYLVIIDAPPVLAVTDAQLLTRHADGAIVVTVVGRTRSAGLTRAVDALAGVDGTVYGVVMNRAPKSRFNRLIYGDAEYGYSAYGGKYGYGGSGAYGDLVEVDEGSEVPLPDEGVPAEAPERAVQQSPSAPVQSPAPPVTWPGDAEIRPRKDEPAGGAGRRARRAADPRGGSSS